MNEPIMTILLILLISSLYAIILLPRSDHD